MAITINESPSSFLTVSDCFQYKITPDAAAPGETRRVYYELYQDVNIIGKRESIANFAASFRVDFMRLAKTILNTPKPPLSANLIPELSPDSILDFYIVHGEVVTTDTPCLTTLSAPSQETAVTIINAALQADETDWFSGGTGTHLMTRRPRAKILRANAFDFIYIYSSVATTATIEAYNPKGQEYGSKSISIQQGVNVLPFSPQNTILSTFTDAPGPVVKYELVIDDNVVARNIFKDNGCDDCYAQVLFFEPLGGWSVLSLEKDYKVTVNSSGTKTCYPVNCKSERRLSNVIASQQTKLGGQFYGIDQLEMIRAFAASPMRYLIKKDHAGNLYYEEFTVTSGDYTLFENEELTILTITGESKIQLPSY